MRKSEQRRHPYNTSMQRPLKHIHFIGVCGTAMGAVAAAVKEAGYTVSGSDSDVYPPMSTFLETRGISLSGGYSPANIPEHADLIVVGNAISRGNAELESVLNRRLRYISLPETLKQFFLAGRHNLVVTGTHGKTTTTSLLTWILKCAGLNPAYLIGGIAKNLGQGCSLHDSDHVVLEGDEYDTAFFDKRSKFLHYLPELVILNNLEFDHADIFQNLEEIKVSFRRLLNIVPENGCVLVNADDPNAMEVSAASRAPVIKVGFGPHADTRIENARYGSGAQFILEKVDYTLSIPGEFNVRNAAMAIRAALFYGVAPETIREAVAGFEGVRRRQEVRGSAGGVTIIDDFGHHPTAIQETLRAMRHQYPGKRIWAVFEPRSNTTRRAVFQQTLPRALAEADGALLSQVARLDQLPEDNRLDPEAVVRDVQAHGKPAFYESGVPQIIERLKELSRPGDIVAVFSNGGFDNIHQRLLESL
jgi:UDP-N-acetylmuramate: L-alanyl-gamma-D-glutamyl-meso-diaminopimelate ligase